MRATTLGLVLAVAIAIAAACGGRQKPRTTFVNEITALWTQIRDWRREATDHPADGNVVNRLLRWGLARPVLLTVLGVVGVAAVFTALLIVGPPGGREA